jgi:hypothetical protein
MTMTALDYEDIRQLHARYSFAVDFGDRAAFENCFTPDGLFVETGLSVIGADPEVRIEGRTALREFAERFFTAGQGHLRHWSSPPIIEVDGDQANGSAFLMVLRPGAAPQVGVILTGVYRDRYRKIDGCWYLAERAFAADPQPEHQQNLSADPLVERFDAFVAGR